MIEKLSLNQSMIWEMNCCRIKIHGFNCCKICEDCARALWSFVGILLYELLYFNKMSHKDISIFIQHSCTSPMLSKPYYWFFKYKEEKKVIRIYSFCLNRYKKAKNIYKAATTHNTVLSEFRGALMGNTSFESL